MQSNTTTRGLPGPAERPDLYDGFDGTERPAGWKNPVGTSERIEQLLAERVAQAAVERAGLDFGIPPTEDALRIQATEGLPAGWVLIENEGALFRGPARGLPMEVWSCRRQAFEPYTGSREKPVEWGSIIGVDEALELMKR